MNKILIIDDDQSLLDTARNPVIWKERLEIYMGKYPVHAHWCMRSVCRKWKGSELVSDYTMFLVSIGRLWRKICNRIHEVGCGNLPVWIVVCTGILDQALQRSIGMTNRQLRRLMIYERLYYTTVELIFL